MSGAAVQGFPSTLSIERWLKSQTGLNAVNRRSLATASSALLPKIGRCRKTSIGIAGAPGSGKSTLARTLANSLQQSGIPCCVLSLDNYYLSQSRRERLAREVHPRFLQRGVPGTHDMEWLLADYDRLCNGLCEGLRLPVFDKSTDDLAPEALWQTVHSHPQVIFLEGWCVGSVPPVAPEKSHPADRNDLRDSTDEIWLSHVNQAWRTLSGELRKRLQQVWYIRVPDWDCVVDWRWRQERELPKMRMESRLDVEDFLASFHGIFRHMQESYSGWADQVLLTDQEHNFHLPD